MKVPQPTRHRNGFTLIEIIGVIALVALLAAILAPRVTGVVSRGKVSSTAEGIASLKTATADYIAKNSSLPLRAGTGSTNNAVATGRFDADLVAGGFTEKLFSCGIGTQTFDESELTSRTHVRSQTVSTSASITAPTSTAGGTGFDLDRDANTADFSTGQVVVSAFIPGVSIADAIALNKQVDGDVNTGTGADSVGRCLYSAVDADNKVTVYVYIAHY
ncbi:MAG: prepilin-type N-terminal cleavage/methylation domain-containing protein [Verrucomicrobiales bacterium]|nr:prepilin-type N-terminal cleavage/methylation domain-containing protein [Verrucomicrobiales bacterium]